MTEQEAMKKLRESNERKYQRHRKECRERFITLVKQQYERDGEDAQVLKTNRELGIDDTDLRQACGIPT